MGVVTDDATWPRVRDDCRHYVGRSTTGGERVERCRIDVNLEDPFRCPVGCLFIEPRKVSGAGWTVAEGDQPDR
jgi:hypothetical protein